MKTWLIFFEITFLYFINFQISAQNLDTLILRPGPIDGIDTEVRDNMDWPKWDDDDFIANAWTANGEYFIQRSLLKFDLNQIPSGRYIISAKLSLYCNTISGHHQLNAGANSSYLLMVTEPWDQYNVHWSNQPATTMDNAIILPQSINQTQDYPNINVTDQINYFYTNPSENYGFMLRLIGEYQYAALVFASSNHIDPSKRPMLEVVYSDCKIPNPAFTYTYTSAIGEVQFETESDSSVTYNWDFGNGAVSNLPNPVYTFPETGTYYVCLTAYNDCDTLTFCDSVNSCIQANANFNYSFTSYIGELQFNSPADPNVIYLWDFGNGDTSNLPNPIYSYLNQGTFIVCLTATSICEMNTFCDTINTCDQASAEFTYNQNIHFIDFLPDFQNISSSYYWTFGDGFYSSLINPEHYYENEGNYEVCLEIHDECGYFVTCKNILILLTNNQSKDLTSKISLFPNPVSSELNLSVLDPSLNVKEIKIFNSKGIEVVSNDKLIYSSHNNSYIYDVSNVNSGMYIICIQTTEGIINRKFVVIRE